MKSCVLLVMIAAMGAGCQIQQSAHREWPAEMSQQQVQALSPDACKAILVARAALEARDGHQIHAKFSVDREGEVWVVGVTYTSDGSFAFPAGGGSTSVYIGPDWTVKRFGLSA